MGLENLEITPMEKRGEKLVPLKKFEKFKVPFNPNSYSISKTVTWNPLHLPTENRGQNTQRNLNAPLLTYGGGGSRQLTLELFFDVTEPIKGEKFDDVRELTDKIAALTRIERDNGQPPICEVSWAEAPVGSDFPFKGVVINLRQNFTLFHESGKPLRANLTVVFKEYVIREQDQRETDPELTTRLVKRGDTLSGIAAELFRDPTLWRIIAEANRIDNPRQLEIGNVLTIPKLS